MRLIDADKLIEDVLNSMPTGSARGVFRAFIEEQPTAFDVDKVLEKFDKYKDMYKRYIANYDMTFGESSRGKLRLVEHLEEIVKVGGIDVYK